MTQQRSFRTRMAAFLKEIYSIWITERPTQFAAALAYYAIFSFIPLIYIAFTIADAFIARLSVCKLPVAVGIRWAWISPRQAWWAGTIDARALRRYRDGAGRWPDGDRLLWW